MFVTCDISTKSHDISHCCSDKAQVIVTKSHDWSHDGMTICSPVTSPAVKKLKLGRIYMSVLRFFMIIIERCEDDYIHPSIHASTHLFIHSFVHPSFSTIASIQLSIHLLVYIPISPESIYPLICPIIHPSIHSHVQ